MMNIYLELSLILDIPVAARIPMKHASDVCAGGQHLQGHTQGRG